jgi:hypothetical protein
MSFSAQISVAAIEECPMMMLAISTPCLARSRVPALCRRWWGCQCGTLSRLQATGHLITSLRRNMKNALMPLMDKTLLRKRSLIETVNDQLKNIA